MTEIVILALSLIFMALFAAAETSFVSADKIALVIDLPSGFKSRSILYFLQNNEVFFATVVVAGNLFVTLFSSIAEIFFHGTLLLSLPVVIICTTVSGFLFGELIPKSIAIDNAEPAARILLPFVRAFSVVARPVVKITAAGSAFIARTVFRSSSSGSLMFQRRDVYRFLGSTVGSGYLDQIESDLIRRFLANAEVPVRSIAVPRTDIVAAPVGTRIEKVREIFEKSRKTKVIVYDSTIDNVVGVVYAKDIFREVDRVDELLSDVLFVPESISVVDLLEEFRTERVYLAILIDEFGGTSGLVTSSDVMELFLGDVAIWANEGRIKSLGKNQYLLQGNAELSEVEEATGVKMPEGDFSTIAGFIMSHLGRIPLRDEVFKIGGLEFRVVRSDGRKIDALKVTVK
ncbi:MAG: hemolysin family protein [Bacteroidetes bacterium]|nr:hemolysin family protein [Bacteroidota bacterium]